MLKKWKSRDEQGTDGIIIYNSPEFEEREFYYL